MKRLLVNLVAILVIGLGGLHLAVPGTANATGSNIMPDEVINTCTAGNGAECECEGACEADSDSCECL